MLRFDTSSCGIIYSCTIHADMTMRILMFSHPPLYFFILCTIFTNAVSMILDIIGPVFDFE